MPASPANTLDPGRRRRQHHPEVFTHFSPPGVPSGTVLLLWFKYWVTFEMYVVDDTFVSQGI